MPRLNGKRWRGWANKSTVTVVCRCRNRKRAAAMMFKKTVLSAILFVTSAVGFVLRERFEMLEHAELNMQTGVELPYQPSLLVKGLAIASVILLAAALSFFGKEWFGYCLHKRRKSIQA